MALFIYVLAGVLSSTALLVLWKLQRYGICALLVIGIIGLVSFVIGGYTAAAVDRCLAPYYFFDAQRVGSEQIKVVKHKDGRFFFSNGESFPTRRGWGEVVIRVTFLLAGGILFVLGRALALLLMRKSLPNLYVELAPYLLRRK